MYERTWRAESTHTYPEQQSLLVGVVLNDASGTVSGKDNIRGVKSLIVHFETKGLYAAEFMELDARGKVRRGRAHFQG